MHARILQPRFLLVTMAFPYGTRGGHEHDAKMKQARFGNGFEVPKDSLLLPELQRRDDVAVAIEIRLLEVIQRSPTLADNLKKPTTRMVILLVSLEVLGELIDSLAEKCNLLLRRAGVLLMEPVTGD